MEVSFEADLQASACEYGQELVSHWGSYLMEVTGWDSWLYELPVQGWMG